MQYTCAFVCSTRLDGIEKLERQQKLIAIGRDFWIGNEQGQKAFKVDGKALRTRDTLKFEDTHGNELCKSREKKVRIKDTMEIEGPDGHVMAKMKKAIIHADPDATDQTTFRDELRTELYGDTWPMSRLFYTTQRHGFAVPLSGGDDDPL